MAKKKNSKGQYVKSSAKKSTAKRYSKGKKGKRRQANGGRIGTLATLAVGAVVGAVVLDEMTGLSDKYAPKVRSTVGTLMPAAVGVGAYFAIKKFAPAGFRKFAAPAAAAGIALAAYNMKREKAPAVVASKLPGGTPALAYSGGGASPSTGIPGFEAANPGLFAGLGSNRLPVVVAIPRSARRFGSN